MHSRLHDADEGAELASLGAGPDSSSSQPFGSIPMHDDGRPSDATPAHDQDYDPVLGMRHDDDLNTSLAHDDDDRPPSRCDLIRQWCGSPKNAHIIRLLKFIAGGLVALALILLIATYSRHAATPDPPTYGVRLPLTVQPTLYTMSLNASLAAATFAGTMEIDVYFSAATDQILLHAIDLDISSVSLQTVAGTIVKPTTSGYVNYFDLYLITLSHTVSKGTSAKLSMQFSGLILPSLRGFYLSTYLTAAGETRTIASTQFESTDARRAFPCFDEPAFKANFSIAITTEAGKVVLGNMPPKDAAPVIVAPGWQRVSFETTVRMSTYLVAYCITDFVSREATATARNIPVRVWTAPDKIDQVGVALQAAVDALNRYEEFFKVPYPLPKLDNVAIPNFAAGAMENWGLVTYRETALLVNNASREAMTEQNVVTTVAHELAHQWFGNIVTMQWWDALWLNEGFASYVEWIGMDAYDDNWDSAGQIIASTQATAMALDSSQYSHPIVQAVADPAEIDSMFDMISYDKGCSILLMLADVMGYYATAAAGIPAYFQNGLESYLTQHAYGNAISDDLWNALDATAPPGLPVSIATFMHKNTRQLGYPLVTLTCAPPAGAAAAAGAAQTNMVVTATQSRFIELPYSDQDPTLRDAQSEYTWNLLLRFQTSAAQATQQQQQHAWMLSTDSSVQLTNITTSDWIYLNSGRYGFYRVNYPSFVWNQLALALQGGSASSLFSNSELCGLLDDVWTLALASHTPYSTAFNISRFLGLGAGAGGGGGVPTGPGAFQQYTPWLVVLTQMGRIASLISSDAALTTRFNQYVVTHLIASNALAVPPWTAAPVAGDHMHALLQQLFVSALVGYGDATARTAANDLFGLFMNQGQAVPVDLRDAVYRVGIEEGGIECWTFLHQQYVHTLDSSEARRILRALTRSTNATQLEVLLDWTLDPTKIKTQDQSRIIIYVSLNPVGKSVAWQWIQSNYNVLYERFGAASFTFSELIARVVGRFQTQAELDQAKAFFANKELGTAKRALLQAYESIQTAIYWRRDRWSEFEAALQAEMA